MFNELFQILSNLNAYTFPNLGKYASATTFSSIVFPPHQLNQNADHDLHNFVLSLKKASLSVYAVGSFKSSVRSQFPQIIFKTKFLRNIFPVSVPSSVTIAAHEALYTTLFSSNPKCEACTTSHHFLSKSSFSSQKSTTFHFSVN
ncbi:MAG: hypothetical protein GY827_03440 [Cytophagales bacterium]|nr:hypothetical protein [Cytophagales bacterium]